VHLPDPSTLEILENLLARILLLMLLVRKLLLIAELLVLVLALRLVLEVAVGPGETFVSPGEQVVQLAEWACRSVVVLVDPCCNRMRQKL
jgi:hypothetical protein